MRHFSWAGSSAWTSRRRGMHLERVTEMLASRNHEVAGSNPVRPITASLALCIESQHRLPQYAFVLFFVFVLEFRAWRNDFGECPPDEP